MGTLKSIFKIDVDDSEFKRFAETFDKYSAELKKQPDAWKKISAQHSEFAAQFEQQVAAMQKMHELQDKAKEPEEKQHKQLKESERLWVSIQKNSTGLYRNVIGIGAQLGKWGTLFMGGGAAIGALAAGAFM